MGAKVYEVDFYPTADAGPNEWATNTPFPCATLLPGKYAAVWNGDPAVCSWEDPFPGSQEVSALYSLGTVKIEESFSTDQLASYQKVDKAEVLRVSIKAYMNDPPAFDSFVAGRLYIGGGVFDTLSLATSAVNGWIQFDWDYNPITGSPWSWAGVQSIEKFGIMADPLGSGGQFAVLDTLKLSVVFIEGKYKTKVLKHDNRTGSWWLWESGEDEEA